MGDGPKDNHLPCSLPGGDFGAEGTQPVGATARLAAADRATPAGSGT